MTIGDAIRKGMKASGLTARGTAKLCGVSNAMVSQYARGHVQPSFVQAAKLALILDFSLDEVASYLELPKPSDEGHS